MEFFGCYQWKPSLKIEPHLVTKTTCCPCSGTIRFFHTMVENMLKEIEVLLHDCKI